MALFELKDVSFSAVGYDVVHDINLQIEKGTTNHIYGKSGCGKSTVLKLLAGLVTPTSGNLYFEGTNVHLMTRKQTAAFRKRAAFVFQDSALWANQDIFQNLELPLRTHFPKMNSKERAKKIDEIVATVGYERSIHNRPAALSMGEQKKISIARAIICEPEILFLDECTDSLDQKAKRNIVSILKEFIYNGNTVVYVSHDSDFVEEIGGNNFYVKDGTLEKTEVKDFYEIQD